ncbi:hypothetical protein [Rhizobium sp. RCAM05973]|nr:hypothetical protein [Rhizobium sp. RCAM05973]
MSTLVEKAVIAVLIVAIGEPADGLIVFSLWYTILHTFMGII